jgi:uncharacterized repeat protein (TIGR01451 family)
MKNTPHPRFLSRNYFSILICVSLLVVAAFASPFYSVRSSSAIIPPQPRANTSQTSIQAAKFVKAAGWSTTSAVFSETIELFAADCSTPKLSFSLGETVCAKTDGVDVTTNPGNYYMNWIDSQLNQTNGGTITQNPQFFLFVPPTAGTWKATIGRVSPADSSIIGNPPIFTVSANLPGVSTFTPDCVTAKTTFTLGETVCATAQATGGAAARRRVVWIDPSGNARQVNDITADPESFSFDIPQTQTSVVGGETVENRGKWKVNVISSRGSAVATTTFVVTDPAAPAADVQTLKSAESSTVSAGSNASFLIYVYNNGPDAAANVVLSDPLPANTTFYSIVQLSGPTFNCTSPNIGSAGTVSCTLASLARDASAQFQLTVQVDTGTPANTVIVNTASSSSDTADPNSNNDSGSASVSVSANGGGGGTCSLACSDDITTPANTVDQNNNSGAIVHFAPPSGNEECGTITVDHCNDCFFPEGSTVVTASSSSGDSCSFTVTVTPAGSHPTISCPGDKTGNADGSCSATFSLGTATASGTNVTVVAFRSDGKPVYTCDEFGNCTRNSTDAPFSVGTTTVTWFAYAHDIAGPYDAQTGDEESHRNGSATCTQTVTVNDVTPPTIGATDQTIAADESCQAAVPDYSSTVSDNCACSSSDQSEDCQNHNDLGYSQTPAAGTMLPPGTYTVHIEANDGTNTATKDITLTVADQTAPAISCPANITTNTDPGMCSATVNPGTATAADNCDTSPTIVGTRSDNQPLNASYPKGTTTIHWTATDDAGNSSSCDQTITVEDHEPPTISCPSNIVLEPTCPSGAVGTYTAPVGQDNCPGAQTTLTAGYASGSVFPIGTTTVTYTVTDASGNSTSCSFDVTVKTVLQTLDDLRESVAGNQQLSGPQRNGLLSKLDAAKQHIQSGNQNGACSKLADFINSVQNFIAHGDLSAGTGNAWISTATHLRNAIGCTNNQCT